MIVWDIVFRQRPRSNEASRQSQKKLENNQNLLIFLCYVVKPKSNNSESRSAADWRKK